jgi:VCBS repeat-containing protein
VTDSAGATSTQNLMVTVTGKNDGAVITGVDTGVVTEDSGVTGSTIQTAGQLTITDRDVGEDHFAAQSGAVSTYGTFSVDEKGRWSYVADNKQTAIQQLKAGDTLTDSFTVSSADGTSHMITVTLKGSNDSPVLTAQSQSVNEDGARLSGHMNATDVDAGDRLTFSAAAVTPGFTLGTDGSYSFDPRNSAYQHLVSGQTQDVIVPITVSDSAGASSTQNLVVTVTGKNDGAVIRGVDTGLVMEDSGLLGSMIQTAGRLTIADRDAGEDHFTEQSGAVGAHGTFSIDPTGHWTYAADNTQAAVQQLKAGDTLTDSFTVSSADGTSHTITVTLNGSNDAPVLTAQTQSVDEDGTKLTGHMSAKDIDAGDKLSFSTTATTPGFTLNTDGSYSFNPSNSAYQHLGTGQTQDVNIPITVTDSAGATSTENLIITVTGKNDGAIISGQTHGAVTEDQAMQGDKLYASGNLTISDSDTGESCFVAQQDLQGQYGSLSIDEFGAWKYVADNNQSAVQGLNLGQTLRETFTVHSIDGSQQVISITVNGSDETVSRKAGLDEQHFDPTPSLSNQPDFSPVVVTVSIDQDLPPTLTLPVKQLVVAPPEHQSVDSPTLEPPLPPAHMLGEPQTQLQPQPTVHVEEPMLEPPLPPALVQPEPQTQPQPQPTVHVEEPMLEPPLPPALVQPEPQTQPQPQPTVHVEEPMLEPPLPPALVQPEPQTQPQPQPTVHVEEPMLEPPLPPALVQPEPQTQPQPQPTVHVEEPMLEPPLPPAHMLGERQTQLQPQPTVHVEEPMLEPPLPSAHVQLEPQPQPQPLVHVEEPMLEPPLPPALVQPEPQTQPQPQPTVHVEEPVLEPPLPPALVQPEPQTQPQPQPTVHVEEPILEPPLPSAHVQPEPQPQPQPTVHVEEPMLEPPLPFAHVQAEPQPQPTVHVEEPMLEPPLPFAHVQAEPQPQPTVHVEEPMLEPPLPFAHVQAEPQPQPTVHVEEPMLEPPLPFAHVQAEPQPQPTVHVEEPMLEPPLPFAHVQAEPQPQPTVHVEEPMLEPPLPQSHLIPEIHADPSISLDHTDSLTAPDTPSTNPLNDYLQFAEAPNDLDGDGFAQSSSNPAIDDYIQAAGVDPTTVTHTAPDLPPTDILVDAGHSGTAGSPLEDTRDDGASLTTAHLDLPELPLDDPQLHGM